MMPLMASVKLAYNGVAAWPSLSSIDQVIIGLTLPAPSVVSFTSLPLEGDAVAIAWCCPGSHMKVSALMASDVMLTLV